MEPRELLRQLMHRANDNPNSLAAKLNHRTKQPQIYKFLEGISREPRRSTLKPIADHYGIDVDAFYDSQTAASEWQRIFVTDELLEGVVKELESEESDRISFLAKDLPQSNSKGIQEESGKSQKSNVDHENTEGDIIIPQYETGGSMGGGRLLLAEQPGLIKSWHVDYEWVRLNVKHYTSLSNLCIVTGFGNSMKPMFNPGDPLLIDKGINLIDHEGIFFFRIGDHGYIKQLQRIPDPMSADLMIRAKSMNEQYDSFDIHPANPHFHVLGKVLTVWKSDQF